MPMHDINFLRFARWFAALLLTALFGSAAAAQSAGGHQHPQADNLAFRRAALAGDWSLHPFREGTPPPPPPPFASQREAGDEPPPLETVARVQLTVRDDAISGTAVFPEGIVLREDNRDVTGRPAVELEDIEFDGETLTFTAMVEGKRLSAELKAKGSRFLGKWRIEGEESAGDLYLVRRY